MRPNVQLAGEIGVRLGDFHIVDALWGVAHDQITGIGPTLLLCEQWMFTAVPKRVVSPASSANVNHKTEADVRDITAVTRPRSNFEHHFVHRS